MLRRVDADDGRAQTLRDVLGLKHNEPIVPVVAEAEMETALLPHDHPKWMKDALSVSQRARELIAHLRPVVVKILSFWDHRVRSSIIGGSQISIDPSGSYRVQ